MGPYDVTIGRQMAALGWAFVLQVMPPESMPWYQIEQGTYQQKVDEAVESDAVAVMVDFEHWLEPTDWETAYRDPAVLPGQHPRDVLFDYPRDSLAVVQRSHRVYGRALESVDPKGLPLCVFRLPLLLKYRKIDIALGRKEWKMQQDGIIQCPASPTTVGKPIVDIVHERGGAIFWPVYASDAWHQHKRRDIGLKLHRQYMANLAAYMEEKGIRNIPVMWHRTQGANTRLVDKEFAEETFKWLAENYGTEWGIWAGPNDDVPVYYKSSATRWGNIAKQRAGAVAR